MPDDYTSHRTARPTPPMSEYPPVYPPGWEDRGRYWFCADTPEDADLRVHICRSLEDEVARVGPGVDGRWWVLMEPRRDPTPPHEHRLDGTMLLDHPTRCTSPRCWNQPVLMNDDRGGVAVTSLRDRR